MAKPKTARVRDLAGSSARVRRNRDETEALIDESRADACPTDAQFAEDPGLEARTRRARELAKQSAAFRKKIPPLIGKKGITLLLEVSAATVKRWRYASRIAISANTHGPQELPVPDRVVDKRPLWYPKTIVKWAVANNHLPRNHGLTVPPVIELWSQIDIAAHFGVSIDTVRDRWRFHYVHAVKNDQEPPPKALPQESFDIEGTPFWLPDVILSWGEQQGKLNENKQPNERHHLRWVAKTRPAAPTGPDPVQEQIDKGELFDRAAIASFFGVSPNTVKMWMSSYSSGKDFPRADGPATRSGKETWFPRTVITWGEGDPEDEGSRRIIDGQVVRARGGRPTGSTKNKTVKKTAQQAAA